MKKTMICFMLLFILISGCENQVGGDYFFKYIDQSELKKNKSKANKLKELRRLYN